MFLLVLLLCGIAGSFCLSWVGVTVIGAIIVPTYAGVMLATGAPLPSAAVEAVLGFAVLQVGYVVGGILSGVLASSLTKAPGPGPVPTERGWFGFWLPLIALRSPPCHADGGPWNGQDDPGYRMNILVVAWMGRGVSVGLSRPFRAEATSSSAAGEAYRPDALDGPSAPSSAPVTVRRDGPATGESG